MKIIKQIISKLYIKMQKKNDIIWWYWNRKQKFHQNERAIP